TPPASWRTARRAASQRFGDATARPCRSSAPPSSSQRRGFRRMRRWWCRSPAGTGSRTHGASWTASPSSSPPRWTVIWPWRGRPVVASRVGGIQDQIQDKMSGRLIDDPRDLAAFGAAIVELLDYPRDAERLGAAAKARVRREFLAPQLLMEQAQLVGRLSRSQH